MTLYELIMGMAGFTKTQWSELGQGLITDEDTVRKMLMEGYGAMVDDE